MKDGAWSKKRQNGMGIPLRYAQIIQGWSLTLDSEETGSEESFHTRTHFQVSELVICLLKESLSVIHDVVQILNKVELSTSHIGT